MQPTPVTPLAEAPLADRAHQRLEALIVRCALAPGQALSIQALQARIGMGRTPTHQAVSRLAADTLILIRPRHGLQIAPIDLVRERTLLRLRRDMERFVVRRATLGASPAVRAQLAALASTLRAGGMDIDAFNALDRRFDSLLAQAAGEPFIEHTLGPLHTMSRRIGWIYHNCACPEEGLGRTIACHLAILDAIAAGEPRAASLASDRLIAFGDRMFAAVGRRVAPALFDCSVGLRAVG